jgi:hypothetical protein
MHKPTLPKDFKPVEVDFQTALDRIAAREKEREENPPKISGIHWSSLYIDWSWKGCGFGQLQVEVDPDTKDLICNNEYMSRDSIRKLLHAYADFIADRCIMDDTPEDVPPVDYKAERIENARLDAEYRAQREAIREQRLKDRNDK